MTCELASVGATSTTRDRADLDSSLHRRGEHNLSANKTRLSSEYDAFLSTYENKLVYAHLLGQVPQLIVTGETGAQEEWVKVVEKRVTFEAKKGRHPGRLRFDGRDGDLTYEAYEEVLDV